MIAIDTNIIVRLLTVDDPEQFKVAIEAIRGQELFLCKTVLLESEWVLRFTYRFPREAIMVGFVKLLGYENLRIEDQDAVLRSLSWYSQGMDFADALHLASCADATRFLTFDRPLAQAARSLTEVPKVELLRGGASPGEG
jgi:predicted nucleic-acid-binding protein